LGMRFSHKVSGDLLF